MKVGAIIFSRMSSSRLPSKALIDIHGRSLLGRVIDITKLIEGVDEIIVATSTEKEDDPIKKIVDQEKLSVFRGSLNDVCVRALDVCNKYNFDKFVRICGDRPFFCHKIITNLISLHNNNDVDIVTNMFPRTYPPGLTGEIISKSALEKIINMTKKADEREHLTKYVYNNPSEFSIINVKYKGIEKIDNLSLTVDNNDDLIRSKWIASKIDFENKKYINYVDKIIELAKEWHNKNE